MEVDDEVPEPFDEDVQETQSEVVNSSKNESKDHSSSTIVENLTKYKDLPLMKPKLPEKGNHIAFKVSCSIVWLRARLFNRS